MILKTVKPSISIVVPVYNSAEILPLLVERLAPVLEGVSDQYELILVNDGSADKSWDVICNLSERYQWVSGINMMRNYGQHNALLCGIRAAQYEVVVTMDDDLQHPPEEIPKLLAKLLEGYDVVYGTPAELPHSWWRNLFSSWIKRFLSWIIGGAGAFRHFSAFRAFRTGLRDAFADYRNPDVNIDVLMSWGSTRFGSVLVKHAPREVGSSNYTFWKLFNVAMQVITTFSTAPLRIASFVGFLFMFFGVILFVYIVILYFCYGTIPGYPTLVSAIALFSGAQLFALGVLGEYLAKMFIRSMHRPSYVVSQATISRRTEDVVD